MASPRGPSLRRARRRRRRRRRDDAGDLRHPRREARGGQGCRFPGRSARRRRHSVRVEVGPVPARDAPRQGEQRLGPGGGAPVESQGGGEGCAMGAQGSDRDRHGDGSRRREAGEGPQEPQEQGGDVHFGPDGDEHGPKGHGARARGPEQGPG